ncbi:MAG: hypothetical protein IPM00_15640 [Tetrasphaera sp.]|nr:hypothetical protein [Tetrasphaera sp.]
MSALLLIVVSAVIGVVVLLTRRSAVVVRALAPAGSGFPRAPRRGAMLRIQAPETICGFRRSTSWACSCRWTSGTSRPLAAILRRRPLVSAAVQICGTWSQRDDDRYPSSPPPLPLHCGDVHRRSLP